MILLRDNCFEYEIDDEDVLYIGPVGATTEDFVLSIDPENMDSDDIAVVCESKRKLEDIKTQLAGVYEKYLKLYRVSKSKDLPN